MQIDDEVALNLELVRIFDLKLRALGLRLTAFELKKYFPRFCELAGFVSSHEASERAIQAHCAFVNLMKPKTISRLADKTMTSAPNLKTLEPTIEELAKIILSERREVEQQARPV